MKVVLVRFKDGERRDFLLPSETTILGRRPDSTLQIPSRDVSRQHCQITIGDDAVVVKDLGSSNGTYVNGKRVAEKKLAPGDRLQVGPVVFVVQIDGRPATVRPADTEVPAAAGAGGPRDEEEAIDLDTADFDLDDALSSLDDLEEDKDLP